MPHNVSPGWTTYVTAGDVVDGACGRACALAPAGHAHDRALTIIVAIQIVPVVAITVPLDCRIDQHCAATRPTTYSHHNAARATTDRVAVECVEAPDWYQTRHRARGSKTKTAPSATPLNTMRVRELMWRAPNATSSLLTWSR